jgi:hypothetical protein
LFRAVHGKTREENRCAQKPLGSASVLPNHFLVAKNEKRFFLQILPRIPRLSGFYKKPFREPERHSARKEKDVCVAVRQKCETPTHLQGAQDKRRKLQSRRIWQRVFFYAVLQVKQPHSRLCQRPVPRVGLGWEPKKLRICLKRSYKK